MSDIAIRVSSVVILQSGGPKMTVASIRTEPESERIKAVCWWFDNDAKLTRDHFPLELLRHG